MIHVCFGIYDKDGRYSKFAGTTIASIFENTTAEVTVHILHDSTLTMSNFEKFVYLAGKYGQQIKFYNVEKLCADKIKELREAMPSVEKEVVSIGTLYRLLMIHIFAKDINKIIYLDSDIIINLDIKKLWQIELDDKPLAAVTEVSNGMDPQLGLPMCREGFVEGENYFNAGVLLMNLERIKGESELIKEGINFQSQHQDLIHFDQDILNWCFSTNYLKLPQQFNSFVRYERRLKKQVDAKIYHYLGTSYGGGITFNQREPFNKLWFQYFEKTPWFNADMIGRIFDGVRQIQHVCQSRSAWLSRAMSGKRRAFFTSKNNLSMLKKAFLVDDGEEVIFSTDKDSLKNLIQSMKKFQGKKLYFIVMGDFTYFRAELTKAGFAEGKDFVNGTVFLSENQGVPMNSYPLIKAM